MSLAQLLNPRVCELGKIKIGGLGDERTAKSGNKYRVPVKYDYFVVTTLHRDKEGKLIPDAALMNSLAHMADADGKLRRLPVSLLSNDLDEVLQAAYLWFNGKKVAAKSDGTTLTVYFDREKREWLKEPKTMPWEPRFAEAKGPDGNQLFRLHCTLNVVVASQAARFGGLYKFRTTSRITSDQLYGSLVHLRQLTGGVLRGLPLQLVVRPVVVAPEGQVKTVYVVHCELLGSSILEIQEKALKLAQFEVSAAKELAAARTEYKRLVCAPDTFADDEEEEEVAQEYHPHQQEGQPGSYAPASPPPPPAQESPAASAPEDNPADDLPPEPDDDHGEDGSTITEPTPVEKVPEAAPAAKIDGAAVIAIMQALPELKIDWPQVRDDRLTPELTEGSGIAAAVGFAPRAGIKCGDLTAEQGRKLLALLDPKLTEKMMNAAKRNAKRETHGAAS